MYAQYLRFLTIAGLRFTLYVLRFIPIASAFVETPQRPCHYNNIRIFMLMLKNCNHSGYSTVKMALPK